MAFIRTTTLLLALVFTTFAQQSPPASTGFPTPTVVPQIGTNVPRSIRSPMTNSAARQLQRTRRFPTNAPAPALTPSATAPNVNRQPNVIPIPIPIPAPGDPAQATPQQVTDIPVPSDVDPNAVADPNAIADPNAAADPNVVDPNAPPIIPPPNTQQLPGVNNPAMEGPPGINMTPGAGDNVPPMLSFQLAPLEDILDSYTALSGKVVLRQSNLPVTGITLKTEGLTPAEAIQAIEATLALNGLTMVPLGDRFVKLVISQQALMEGSRISELPPEQLPESEEFVTRIVKLKVAKPSEIAPLFATFTKNPAGITAIDSNNTLILRDYASNVKRMLEIIARVDVPAEIDFKLEVIPIKYGRVADIYATMSALISGATGGAAATGGGSAGFGGGGFGGGGFGGGGFGGNQQFGGQGFGGGRGGNQRMNNRSRGGGGFGGGGYTGGAGTYYPQDAAVGTYYPQQAAVTPGTVGNQGSFQQRVNQLVNRAANPNQIQVLENAHIVPDERSNRLLIFANKRDMDMITNIVAKVDVLLAQVMIEAVIMEVALDDTFNFGVSALQSPKRFGADFTGVGGYSSGQSFLNQVTNLSGLGQGLSYWGRIGNELDVAVQAIATDSRANVISRPRIITSHALPGHFFIGETVPYVTGFTDYGGFSGGGLSTRSSVEQAEVGFSLDVVPFITPDGLIVMQMDQNFDTRGADVVIEGNPIPIINRREASSVLTMRDGDTIMMGGFITDAKSETKSGVPFLKDIPGLGALFRSTGRTSDRTELIVLLRAKIIHTPEDAAVLAADEKSQLPGVRQTENETNAAQEKRLNKVREQERKQRAKAGKRH